MADAAHDHARDKRCNEKMTHTRAAYADLCAILAGRECSPFQRGASCDFCKGCGTLVCDCLWMVAWGAVDMFIRVVLDYVNEDPSERRLQSPRGEEVVPIESTNALCNIAGALLFKAKKRSSGQAIGVTEHQRCACLAFTVAHSLEQPHARQEALPVDKVVRVENSTGSLTYVSAPLYHFFCRLELVYWVNLNLRGVGELSVDTMQNISAFAHKEPRVLVAWQRCIERVEEKTATLVCEVATRSECVFEMLAKTYRNVRGKEYTTVIAARNRRTGDVRTSTIRDQLAAGLAVSAKPNKTAVQLRW